MSTLFGTNNLDKLNISEAIKIYAALHPDYDMRDIIENVMEAVSYGLKCIIYDRDIK